MDVETGVIGIETPIGRDRAQTLIDAELPLPEGRTAAKILLCNAEVISVRATAAEDAANVTGRLCLQVVCESPSGEPFAFSLASEFSHAIAIAGAAEGMAARASAQVMESRLEIAGAALHLHAIVEIDAAVSCRMGDPLVTRLSGEGIEQRQTHVKTASCVPIGAVETRIREEIATPSACEVLLCRASAQIKELTYHGTRLMVEGSLYVTALTASDDGELTEQMQILPFTDELEAPYAEEVFADAEVIRVSAVAADMSFGVADVEAVVSIGVYAIERGEADIIADAYDEAGSFACQTREIAIRRCIASEQKRFPMREPIRIDDGMPDAYRTVYAAASIARTGAYETEDGRLGIDAMVFVHALYRCDGGQLHAFDYDLPVQLNLDAAYTDEAEIALSVLSAQLTGGGRTPELLLTLEARAEVYALERLSAVAAIEPCGEEAEKRPRGIVIYCTKAGESAFSLGKRFGVTLDHLAAWNPQCRVERESVFTDGEKLILIC